MFASILALNRMICNERRRQGAYALVHPPTCERVDIDALAYDDFWASPNSRLTCGEAVTASRTAESDEEIRGYICYESMEDHFRIVRLVVHPRRSRQGHGRYLLSRLERKVHGSKCWR